MRNLFSLLLILSLVSCSKDYSQEVKSCNWKYGSGYYISDWIVIREGGVYLEDNNSLVRGKEKIGTIVRIRFGELVLESLDGERGTYHCK